jgi:hypothetical protein
MSDLPVKSGRFRPGNPGKPKGAKHKSTQLMEAIVTADPAALKEVGTKVVEKAHAGTPWACQLIFDRLWPIPRGRLVKFELPPLDAGHALGHPDRAERRPTGCGERHAHHRRRSKPVIDDFRPCHAGFGTRRPPTASGSKPMLKRPSKALRRRRP